MCVCVCMCVSVCVCVCKDKYWIITKTPSSCREGSNSRLHLCKSMADDPWKKSVVQVVFVSHSSHWYCVSLPHPTPLAFLFYCISPLYVFMGLTFLAEHDKAYQGRVCLVLSTSCLHCVCASIMYWADSHHAVIPFYTSATRKFVVGFFFFLRLPDIFFFFFLVIVTLIGCYKFMANIRSHDPYWQSLQLGKDPPKNEKDSIFACWIFVDQAFVLPLVGSDDHVDGEPALTASTNSNAQWKQGRQLLRQ